MFLFLISDEELLHQLKKELEFKYKGWCAQIQPIPGGPQQYEVEKVFIDRPLIVSDDCRNSNNWSGLNSYNDIFKQDSKRIIIEAEPGYGKSTMILQAAKDWCIKDTKSSLKDVEILILLRLKMLKGITGFYEAVKTTLLPMDTTLLTSQIKRLVRECKSVVVALDDFDEYPDKKKESDFLKILKGDMLQNCKVILLTRISILPEDYHGKTKFMQLKGFSNENQTQYMAKVETPEGYSLKEVIKELHIGDVIRDILTVPSFFTMLAHMNEFPGQSQREEGITTVTTLFKIFIKILEGRLTSHIEESETLTLGKAALYGLVEQNEGKSWRKTSLIKEIGEPCCQKFVEIGILVETEERDPNNHKEIEKAADKVIKYLESGLYGENFALLCTLEKTGKVDDIKEQIKDMCKKTVSFFEGSSRLLRKSTALLLEIASTEKIPIECILFDRCYALVEEHLDHLGMISGMSIPPLVTLKELIIYGVGRRLAVKETTNIFLYVCRCDSLTKLRHDHIQKKTEKVEEMAGRFGLNMNVKKCKHMRMNNRVDAPLKMNNIEVEDVEEFVYLGAKASKDGGGTEDMKNRLGRHVVYLET
ncbi:hypothetical protein BSL78_01384 [Apostichopus japonicus]|uniref:NACHT domain-containing protein n=1 Tax=Stichopus japonicus TaxID=307972 RepID=A0A2G8LNB7_STIJA|nr:hypothetical protein BSL78_01384 [Apostichopus japonicus]